ALLLRAATARVLLRAAAAGVLLLAPAGVLRAAATAAALLLSEPVGGHRFVVPLLIHRAGAAASRAAAPSSRTPGAPRAARQSIGNPPFEPRLSISRGTLANRRVRCRHPNIVSGLRPAWRWPRSLRLRHWPARRHGRNTSRAKVGRTAGRPGAECTTTGRVTTTATTGTIPPGTTTTSLRRGTTTSLRRGTTTPRRPGTTTT